MNKRTDAMIKAICFFPDADRASHEDNPSEQELKEVIILPDPAPDRKLLHKEP